MLAAQTGSRTGAPETVSNGGGNRVPVGNRQQLKFTGFAFIPISPTCPTCRRGALCKVGGAGIDLSRVTCEPSIRTTEYDLEVTRSFLWPDRIQVARSAALQWRQGLSRTSHTARYLLVVGTQGSPKNHSCDVPMCHLKMVFPSGRCGAVNAAFWSFMPINALLLNSIRLK